MTRRQLHLGDVADVPRADDDPARRRVALDRVDRLLDLIDALPAPVAPLVAVDRPELAVGVGPGVPDRRVLGQIILDVGRPAQEPQQLADHRREQHLLRGQERKPGAQVVARLGPEHRQGANAGPVGPALAVVEDVLHQVEIRAHARRLYTIRL